MEDQVPGNFHLWKLQSAWTSHAIMCRVLNTIAKSVAPYMASHHVVLVLDVAKQHIHQSLVVLAGRLDIQLVYIQSKLTWLLQPCDTHAFAQLKRVSCFCFGICFVFYFLVGLPRALCVFVAGGLLPACTSLQWQAVWWGWVLSSPIPKGNSTIFLCGSVSKQSFTGEVAKG